MSDRNQRDQSISRSARITRLSAFLLFVGAEALAVEPLALILEIDGTTEPQRSAFSELSAGDSVKIGTDSRLLLLRYDTCSMIELTGGRIVGSDKGLDLGEATIGKEEDKGCPAEIRIDGNAVMGGLVVRSAPAQSAAQPISIRPSIVFLGPGSHRVNSIALERKSEPVFRGVVSGNEFSWPNDQAPLQSGIPYDLILYLDRVDDETRSVRVLPQEEGIALNLIRFY